MGSFRMDNYFGSLFCDARITPLKIVRRLSSLHRFPYDIDSISSFKVKRKIHQMKGENRQTEGC